MKAVTEMVHPSESPLQPQTRSRGRIITLARVVALVAIAVVVLALTWVRSAPASSHVAVPNGAKPGEIFLHGCTFSTEAGALPADCGTLVVPENRNNSSSRLIALPVTRIRARSGHSAEPIFKLEGGPGKSNMTFEAARVGVGT